MEGEIRLSELQLDSLKELTNIAMGQAATALAQMIDKKVTLSVPEAKLVPLSEVPEQLGGSENEVVCLFLKIQGDVTGSTLFVFDPESALVLTKLLLGMEVGEEMEDISEIGESALKELGNIFTNVYLNALAEMLKIKVQPSLPYFARDMLGAVIDMVMIEIAMVSDYAMVLDTKIEISDYKIHGNFLILPDRNSLELIFKGLEIS